jgi:hypothetical protein
LLYGRLEEEDRFQPRDGEGDEGEADGRREGHDEARRRGSQNGHCGVCSVLSENERGGDVRVRRVVQNGWVQGQNRVFDTRRRRC